jgi:hypothetical protein
MMLELVSPGFESGWFDQYPGGLARQSACHYQYRRAFCETIAGESRSMPMYTFRLEGRKNEGFTGDYESVDQARNEAVRFLGTYLSEHPRFADEGHWRLNVQNAHGEDLLHVIVATVTARKRF